MKRCHLILCLILLSCGGKDADPDRAFLAMNRGLAQLENFEYFDAAKEFREAVGAAPDWADAKVNLAISLMNMRGPEDTAEALRLLSDVLAGDPSNLHANFIVGFLTRLMGEAEQALPYFDRVLEQDPDDPATLYWKGMAVNDLARYEEAVDLFDAAIRADPYLAAAYYSRHGRLIVLGRRDEAKASMETSKRLSKPPGKEFPIQGSMITALAYHEIGRYAMAIRNYEGAPAVPPGEESPGFESSDAGDLAAFRYGGGGEAELVTDPAGAETVREAVAKIGPGVVLGDYDGDGDADVFLPQWDGTGRLYANEGELRFSDVTDGSGIDTPCLGISGAFFDADGDGDQDLYVTAAGPNVFYLNLGDGTFKDLTSAAGLAGDPRSVSLQTLPGDFDHEGDIDLFVAGYAVLGDDTLAGAPDVLFQNNRDGTFTDIAAEKGIDGGIARTVGALSIDIDRDLDTDLLVIRDRAPAALWLNERIWDFRPGELPLELMGDEPAWGAAAGDIDRDGVEEVVVFRGPGADAFVFHAESLEPRPGALNGLRWRTGVFLDADLDGALDLVGDAVALLDGAGGARAGGPLGPVPADSRGIGFADFDGDGDLDRVYATNDAAGVVATIAPKENHWVAFELQGREALQPAAYAARTGPDAELEIRARHLWQPLRARTGTGFLSTVESPVRFGLGSAVKAELVRILWPDRVLQVEAEIPADALKEIVEVNRKPASCPMLFGWDGERFRFVSDFLGVGGLGFFLGPDLYGDSDGDEYVLIGEWLRPVDGELVLQALEPLEEVTYFDEAALVVVDHPAGTTVHPNERYAGEKALFPEDRIYCVTERVFPAAATDASRQDILPTLLAVDRVYAPVEPDLRFPGVAEEHAVVLDFTGRVPETGEGGRLILFLDGWIEYGYSNTFFAAYQAGVVGIAPALEVPDGKGGWKTVIPNIGCPAGLPKGMTVDVTGIVGDETPVVRIRTNYEVYWDRAFLARDDAPGRIRVTRVGPSSAHLHDRGYPREYSPDGRQPLIYDYGIMDPGYPFKNFKGDFTRFGDVSPLLEKTDDMYVIMGHGEELTLKFAVSALPSLEEGWSRTYILYSAGWCKDMDPYTAHPDTVKPLPFRGMSGYPYGDGEAYPDTPEHRAYREKWNTRRVLGE